MRTVGGATRTIGRSRWLSLASAGHTSASSPTPGAACSTSHSPLAGQPPPGRRASSAGWPLARWSLGPGPGRAQLAPVQQPVEGNDRTHQPILPGRRQVGWKRQERAETAGMARVSTGRYQGLRPDMLLVL